MPLSLPDVLSSHRKAFCFSLLRPHSWSYSSPSLGACSLLCALFSVLFYFSCNHLLAILPLQPCLSHGCLLLVFAGPCGYYFCCDGSKTSKPSQPPLTPNNTLNPSHSPGWAKQGRNAKWALWKSRLSRFSCRSHPHQFS